jgi:hypothetical protein
VLAQSAIDKAPDLQYFYPAGNQLAGDQVPTGAYTQQIDQQAIQDIINGGTPGPAGGDQVYIPGPGQYVPGTNY